MSDYNYQPFQYSFDLGAAEAGEENESSQSGNGTGIGEFIQLMAVQQCRTTRLLVLISVFPMASVDMKLLNHTRVG